MDVTPLVREGLQIIQAYTADGFKVAGQSYNSAVVVFPEETISWDGVSDFSNLTEESFSILVDRAGELDVILLGTGAKIQFLSPKLQSTLQAKGLFVDVMDTGAACRTFNVLVAEGRRVAAAILPNV